MNDLKDLQKAVEAGPPKRPDPAKSPGPLLSLCNKAYDETDGSETEKTAAALAMLAHALDMDSWSKAVRQWEMVKTQLERAGHRVVLAKPGKLS